MTDTIINTIHAVCRETTSDFGRESMITVKDLQTLLTPDGNGTFAVLVINHDSHPDNNGQAAFQFVTFGKDAEDKARSVRMREMFEKTLYGEGGAERLATYEDFVADAAKHKEKLDRISEAINKYNATTWHGEALATIEAIVTGCCHSCKKELPPALLNG